MTSIDFHGLSVLIHQAGQSTAQVVLPDPRSYGGPRHASWFTVTDPLDFSSVPDSCFYDADGHVIAAWALEGCKLVVEGTAKDAFDIERSQRSDVDPDRNDQGAWSSVRWLPEYAEPAQPRGLSPEDAWPTQARLLVRSGRLHAVPPNRPGELPRIQFVGANGTELTPPRLFATSMQLTFADECVVRIAGPYSTRVVPLPEGSHATISNASCESTTFDGHEDATVLAYLEEFRSVRTKIIKPMPSSAAIFRPLNPDVCGPKGVLL